MNYEKKYREAIKAVEELREANPNDEGINEWLKDHFLELINKDEAIRLQIIDHIEWSQDEMLISSEEKERWTAWLEKQGDQKPAEWSEEERQNVDSIIAALTYCNENGIRDCFVDPDILIDCLKDRVKLLSKNDWSDQDSINLKMIKMTITAYANISGNERKALVRWVDLHCNAYPIPERLLKHWKPTEQQMKVLNEVINFAADHGTMRWNDYIYNVLKGLREQLKKLTE